MTDEAASVPPPPPPPPPPAVVAPRIEIIVYGDIRELTSVGVIGVIDRINECVAHNQQIELKLDFNDRFDATIAMQNTITEKSRHIKKITFFNNCSDKEEQRKCFNFFTRIVRGIMGNGKHLSYVSYKFEFELEQANQLADALRSNNNNNDTIESFDFDERYLTPETFQLLWNSLLDSGVRKITFGYYYVRIDNNINIDFTGMETNTSLKELDLTWYLMREDDYRSLFHSMKKNKGLEKLSLNYDTYKELSAEMKRLFEEMMCENLTLLDCCLDTNGDDVHDGIFEKIQFHMKVNRIWKRYLMQREREKKTRTVRTRIEEGDNNNNNNNNNNEEKEEEERKKRLKMRMLFHEFHQKTVMRDTIIFHLLREYPNDLVSNTNNEHP